MRAAGSRSPELGRRLHLGPSATTERVKRLEESGVIRGYRAAVDLDAVGISLLAVVRLKYAGSRHEPFLQHLQGSPQFLDCLRVTGEDCYVIKLGVVYSQSLAPRGPSRSLANL
jgi:Lrp/AsnC family leucine-responsive transcriptional regulator